MAEREPMEPSNERMRRIGRALVTAFWDCKSSDPDVVFVEMAAAAELAVIDYEREVDAIPDALDQFLATWKG